MSEARSVARGHGGEASGRRLAALTLLAIGVVYGDLGTSPLYAFQQSFSPEYGLARTPENIYGIISLIIWSLFLVVSVKYIVFLMRADNRGEGGILALLALLLRPGASTVRRFRGVLVALGLIGAALLYGDGVITPAISVLSAVEGLTVVSPALTHLVVPLALAILVVLFLFQRHGTGGIGKVFGPIMVLWFIAIGALGLAEVIRQPHILSAFSPWYGVRFFLVHGHRAFLVLGAIVLCVTGTEALYADMGHFGKRPIRLAWGTLILPALLLNYLGQGALVLESATAAENPFYLLAPRVLLYPLIALATTAAVIASQALISGAFSLTQQCVQLGYAPRFNIVHTSASQEGQIYVPEVNSALMVGCIVMVLGFRSSIALGAAYGIAVTGTMAITTLLFTVLARTRLGWSAPAYIGFAVFFLTIDLGFFASNVLKIAHGGWVPLAIAFAIFTLMTTWHKGRALTQELLHASHLPLDMVLTDLGRHHVARVPGTGVFLTADPTGAPSVLLHHLKHNKVLHEAVVLLTVVIKQIPTVPETERIAVLPLPEGFWRVTATYGFMEQANVQAVMERARAEFHVPGRPLDTTFYLGRERILPFGGSHMARWRKKLYAFLARNSRPATEFFNIPPNRVVEMGAQLEL